jgi:hypothetical protein
MAERAGVRVPRVERVIKADDGTALVVMEQVDGQSLGQLRLERRILMVMKPALAGSRRFLPASPFNAPPADPPAEQFAVRDQVTHDKYGLGRVILAEDDTAVVVDFGSRRVRILSPFIKLTKL